jgi:cytoskeleton protein RodZ
MGELGQLLRETREEKGFSPEDVEEQTRIRARFVRALEDGNYDELPTPGHVSGFMRNYALFLGLDVGEVRALFAKESNSRGLFDPGIFHPKDIELAPRRPLIRATLVLGLVIVVVVLVVGGWAFWRYGLPNVQPLLRLLTPSASTPAALAAGTSIASEQALTATATEASPTRPNLTRIAATREQEATSTSAPPTATSLPPTATATQVVPTPTATRERPLLLPTPTPSPTATPTASPTRAGGVVVQIRVIERSWMQATVDDVERQGELLEAGEERTWEGQYAIYFICGNAGGVEATVNGQELGVLGERAQVVEKTWTPEGEVTPTPAATATRAASP